MATSLSIQFQNSEETWRLLNELYNDEFFRNNFNRCYICGAKNPGQKDERCRGACTPEEAASDPVGDVTMDTFFAVVHPDGTIEYLKEVEVYEATPNGFVRRASRVNPSSYERQSNPNQRGVSVRLATEGMDSPCNPRGDTQRGDKTT